MKYSDSEQSIILMLGQPDRQALIQVHDRGVGIPLHGQSRIFERFYRGDESRARSTGGHGLGLTVVKTLVEGAKSTSIRVLKAAKRDLISICYLHKKRPSTQG